MKNTLACDEAYDGTHLTMIDEDTGEVRAI
jgi:hypothetical protein